LVFDNYEIVTELPRGGQAVVYKAVHVPTGTNVAIKVLLPSLLASARARYYFEREAELIASLDHPCIVKIRDSGIIHHQYFFVMEYIEGQPLDKYVQSQNPGFKERIRLFSKICDAVSYAHQQGIIHRDLKFGNILIDKWGEPHILDFGLAKAVSLSEEAEEHAVHTRTGQWAGSLSNMSPEQAAATPDLIDVRTDVYALGMILYNILTGRYPYEVTGPVLKVLRNIQEVEPVRPSRIIRRFDSDMEAILLTSLEKDRTRRYQSVAGFQSDIESWLEGRPVSIKSASTVYLVRKLIKRHRYSSAVAGLLLLIVVCFSLVSFDLYLSARKAKTESDAIAGQWAQEAARVPGLQRQLTFISFLDVWRAGRAREATQIARYLVGNTKEREAAIFLLDPALLSEKEAGFRESVGDGSAWFADFIIGEHHLKDGNRKEALAALQRSYDDIRELGKTSQPDFERAFEVQIITRLYELSMAETQAGPATGRGG
jgi:hypothetical protein